MNYNRWYAFVSAGASLTVLAGVMISLQTGPLVAQQLPEQVPFAGVPAEEANYPSGDRLQSQYDTIPGGAALPGFRATMTEDAVGFAVAAEVQSGLPEGFVLQRGRTAHVMSDLPQRIDAEFQDVPADRQAAPASQGKYLSNYSLEYRGVPLAKGSDYLTIVSEDGRLLATRVRGLPTEVDATEPTVSAEAAADVAREDAGDAPDDIDFEVAESMLEIWVDENEEGRLAWRIILESDDLTDPHGRQYWISAIGEPEVIHWESTIYHTHFGTVSGNLWDTSPLAGTQNRPLGDLQVNRAGAGGGSIVSGPDGRYGFTSGTGNANIQATLTGPRVAIQNMAGAVMAIVRSGSHANAINLNFGASQELEFSQVSAFYWTNLARRLSDSGLAVDPTHQMPTRVNIADSCNAFYRLSDKSINFFQAGGVCPNTAYSDVVLHEFGHYLDHVNGGILDGGWSEGAGDAIAILGTRQPCLGRDFLGANTCLRPATDLVMWPPTPGEGVHARGRRYAGFVWELVDQLKVGYGEDAAFDIAKQLVVATFVANPSSIPDAVHLAFLLDDNDGDLTNGTPHFGQLAAAADSRNLPRPPDPVDPSAMAVASSAQFPWTPVKKVSSNSNILQAQLKLDQEAEVHISANSSARTLNAPLMFRTGFLNQPQPSVMWTNSLRNVTLQHPGQWANFGSKFAIKLPAGVHTFYLKIWVTGGELEFSSGSLLVEAFGTSGAPLAVATLEPQVTVFEAESAVEEPLDTLRLDDSDPEITVIGTE
jgi:hypothetical protein